MQLMLRRRSTLALPLSLLPAIGVQAALPMVTGSYDVAQMKAMKGLTFPRVLLYRSDGKLVDREDWPNEMTDLKQAAGDAFCCVSDKPSPPGWTGPPRDCKIVVYGENLDEHFTGLTSSSGIPLRRSDLPKHKYLVVEYFAAWCAPCLPARKALEAYLGTSTARDTVALVVDFTKLAPGK